jgi:hypothetical protein
LLKYLFVLLIVLGVALFMYKAVIFMLDLKHSHSFPSTFLPKNSSSPPELKPELNNYFFSCFTAVYPPPPLSKFIFGFVSLSSILCDPFSSVPFMLHVYFSTMKGALSRFPINTVDHCCQDKAGSKQGEDVAVGLGELLLILSLACDGITGAIQVTTLKNT